MGKHSKLVRLIWAFPSLVWAGQAVGQDRVIDLVRDNKINQDYRLSGRTAAHILSGSLVEWRWLVSYSDYWKDHNENKGTKIWGENNLCANYASPGKCWPGASESMASSTHPAEATPKLFKIGLKDILTDQTTQRERIWFYKL